MIASAELLAQLEIESHGFAPDHVRARAVERRAAELELERQHWLDAKLEDIERVFHAAGQMKLKLPKMDQRARVRDQVAHYLETVVMPTTWRRDECELASRLRDCRQDIHFGVLPDNRLMVRWDQKASLPLLCPDDAREEGMRLSRRLVPHLVEAESRGYRTHFSVVSPPNIECGQLRGGMKTLLGHCSALMRACRRKRDRPFPIAGLVAVLEAPLSRLRNWNVHVNLIVVVEPGAFFDYGAWQAYWARLYGGRCSVKMRDPAGDLRRMNEGRRKHGQRRDVRALRESLERAFREVLKYAVRAVPDKSQEHATRDEDLAGPALTEWAADEFLEWWRAHKRQRRTRTFGRLYRLPKPEKVDRSGIVWFARATRAPWGWRASTPLLFSIPGDNSTIEDLRENLRKIQKRTFGTPEDHARWFEAGKAIVEAFKHIDFAAL